MPSCFDAALVINEMHLGIGAFNENVRAPGRVFLSVPKHPAFQVIHIARRGNLKGQALVGQKCSVCRQSFLPVGGTLHRPQHVFEISPDMPRSGTPVLRETHLLKNDQTRRGVMLLHLRKTVQSRIVRVYFDREVGVLLRSTFPPLCWCG